MPTSQRSIPRSQHSASHRHRHLTSLLAGLSLLLGSSPGHADTLRLLVAKTANETGLITYLANAFEADHPDSQLRIISAGGLDTLVQGRTGIADAIISHTPESEELFMADGYGISHTLIMYNNFAIFGPPDDPLELRQQTDLLSALRIIAENEPPFLVQGYRSGTYYRLLQLWAAARIRPTWLGYESTDGSSPTTLSTAAEFGAYAFADLGTYFSLPAERRAQLVPLVRDHRALRNDYHYLVIDPDRAPGVNRALAEDFLAFLISDKGQRLIGQFGSAQAPVSLYTPAAHLDQELMMLRTQQQVAAQQQQMYLLGAAVAAALALSLFGAFIYRRARELAQLTTSRAQRIERAIAGSREGLFEWDMVAGSLYCTPLMTELLELPDSDAHNLHALLRQALDNSQASQVSAALQHYLGKADGSTFSIELDINKRRLELRGQASRDTADNPIRMAGSLRELVAVPATSGTTHSDDALRDPVTGLPARQLLTDRLQHTIQQCARARQSCIVLMIGLNAVRTAEALSESPPDDAMIKAVAARLRQLLRASDTIARMDDDNFAILLPASDERHCRLAVEKLAAGMARPFHVNNQSVHVDGAIGCAIYPEHGQHHNSLLQRAQLAMLQATRDNQPVAIYRPGPRAADTVLSDHGNHG